MSGTGVAEAVEAVLALSAAYDRFAAADLSCLSRAELLQVSDEYESLMCRMPSQLHRILAALQSVTTAVAMGAKNWKQVLATRWRISTAEAHRRLTAARELGPRTATTGEPLEPEFPAVAAAQSHGAIGAEHIAIIRDVVRKVKARFDAVTAAQMEVSLVRLAIKVGPAELSAEAARRLTLLDQDGPEPDDRERDRSRGVRIGAQRRNGNTPIEIEATPAVAAGLAAFYAKFAAPGMCNPDDPQPCVSGTPTQAQIDNDHRTLAQRRHDALEVMTRIALSSDLGTLNGLPVSIIVKTTVADLQAMAGVAVAGDGTTMSIKDLIRLGAHAHWSLAVFDGATGSALDLFRTKRVATAAQRLMLIARDWGCTKPGCPVGPYGCQVHHAARDWGAGGNTNVDENALACPADNRLVGPQPHQWSTDVVEGVVHWHPPDHLDTGQATVNYRNRPDQIPLPDETAPLPWDTPPPPGGAREPLPDNATPADPVPDLDDPDALDAFAVWAFGDDTTPAPFIRFHAGTLQSFTATTRTRTELSRLIHRCRTRDPQGARGPAPPR
ncbi:HNH endonuclease signature motif containing protein [Mycolicibacterium arenosum]|uniref:HNH endonuclease n=1 Tax=Mycolicibacterium arenosum TaxID=2952157 RepID=A0ABT1LUR9_9MYCO|nr:HNH endonuclease signature motif containing protein [Mycolicibacterium sp. CAU 1645]MCP9270638.1 HNH endonuclease [Mycolicibacterium sp. CAU 1645]